VHIGIDYRLPHYRIGGISQYVLQLVAALAEMDRENHYSILRSRKDGQTPVPIAPNFTTGSLWTPCHHKLERWTLAAELLPRKLDLLHSPDFIPPSFGARRRVITVHDLNFLFFPQFLTKESTAYYTRQIEWAVRVADHIVADSDATRNDVIEMLNVSADKVSTVWLAASKTYEKIPTSDAVDETLADLNLPRGFVLFVGTLEPRKNLPTLLQAYAILRREEGFDRPLVMVGQQGWLDQQIAATLEQLNLGDCVIQLGGIGDERLAHIYRAAGVLVMPSFYEGFGLPILEAMTCDCPVIASNRGSLPEVVGKAGILCEPGDEEAWAAALARVLTEADVREKMVVEGRIQAKKFSWSNTARSMLSIYERVGQQDVGYQSA